MQRELYSLGIFFLGLYLVAALFQSILFFQIDYHLFHLPSFAAWYLVLVTTFLAASLFLLSYYHHKAYRFALITGSIHLFAAFLQFCVTYFGLLLPIGELHNYYSTVSVLAIVAGLIYAFGILFSGAGKIIWLRTAGIVMLLAGGLSLYPFFLILENTVGQSGATLLQFSQWSSLASSLLPIPFILLFYKERKAVNTSAEASNPNKSTELLYAAGFIALALCLTFGSFIGNQAYGKLTISPATIALAKPFEAKAFANSKGDSLVYRLLKPLEIAPRQQYPLVVCLHGGAGWGTDNFRNIEGSLFARELSRPENRRKYPAFLFVPQCPSGSSWGGVPNTVFIDSLVFEAITALTNEFPIDDNRVYVVGHSLGGYGAWYFAATRPEMFAAAIPVAGEGDPNAAARMLTVPIWAFHGAKDKNVPVTGSRNVIEAIRKAGGEPRYTEVPDAGHGWEIVTEEPGVLEWLFDQKREKREDKPDR